MQKQTTALIQKSFILMGAFLFLSLLSAQKSFGELAITADDMKIKFGVLMQGQIDETYEDGGYVQNVFLRRMRLLVGGQIAPNVTFFYESDNPNLGKETASSALNAANAGQKNLPSSGLNTLDAVLTWKAIEPINIDMGLILVPLCRNCLQSAAMLLPLDYGANSFNESTAIGADIGRDTGVQLRSYLINDKLEIRAGMFQGTRADLNVPTTGANSANSPFRYTVRAQYDFLDAEKGLFYTGTYLGTKRVAAVGASFDNQGDYKADAVDAFVDLPVGGNLAVTLQGDLLHYIPGQMAPTSPTYAGLASTTFVHQVDYMVEAGILQTDWHVMPFLQYQDEQRCADRNYSGSDSRKFVYGIAYYMSGYNANLKIAGATISDDQFGYASEATIQLQGFYF